MNSQADVIAKFEKLFAVIEKVHIRKTVDWSVSLDCVGRLGGLGLTWRVEFLISVLLGGACFVGLLHLEALDGFLLLDALDARVEERHEEDAREAEQYAQDLEQGQGLVGEDGRKKGLVESVSAHERLSRACEADGDTDGDKDTSEAHEETCSGSEPDVVHGNGEIGISGQRDQEHGEHKEFNDCGIKSLFNTIILGLVLADQEMLSRDDSWATESKNNSEHTVDGLAATAACLQFFVGLNLATVAASGGTDADNGGDHEHDTNQMKPADLLTEAEVESDHVDQRGQGEKGRDDALVDSSELCEVPGIGHHDQIAHINSRVSEERDQVRPLQFTIGPNQTRVFGISPSAIFHAVDDDSDRPKQEENDENTRSTEAATLESQVSVVSRKDCSSCSHEEACCE